MRDLEAAEEEHPGNLVEPGGESSTGGAPASSPRLQGTADEEVQQVGHICIFHAHALQISQIVQHAYRRSNLWTYVVVRIH
jgi:hypothetical protein